MDSKELIDQRKKIVKGLELTYKKLVEFKKKKNTPIVVSEEGEIKELDPYKVLPTTVYKWH